jgi:hypothetical protein
MHLSLFLIPLLALVFCSSARAVDYSQVDRTIAKEPAYQSPPKYALLLFSKGGTREQRPVRHSYLRWSRPAELYLTRLTVRHHRILET